MVCGWLHVEEGAVVGRDGAGNPCRMRPGRDPAQPGQGLLPPCLSWLGRAAGRVCIAPVPCSTCSPSCGLSLQPSLAQMWGTARGSAGGTSPFIPDGSPGCWGSGWRGLGVPGHWDALSPSTLGAHRVLGVADSWEGMSQVLEAGPDWWTLGQCWVFLRS